MDIKKTWLFTKPIAHRGLHTADKPENSLAAFSNAVENNFPIELDLRLTADNTVVVFHDEKLSRMTKKDGYISNTSDSELKGMNLLGVDGEPTSHFVPTFQEVLEEVGGRVPILIEIKTQGGCGPLEGKIIEMLRSYKGEVAVQSFNPYSMEYFKNNAFEIPRGQLATKFTRHDLSGFIRRNMLRKLKMNHISQPDFIAYRFDLLPNKWTNKTKLPLLAWTLRSNTDMEKVIPFCDNIIFENFIPKIEEK